MHFQIDKYLLDDLLNSEHPSDFQTYKDYAIFILRLPYIDQDTVKVFSYAFLIHDDKVYRYDRKKQDFIELGDFAALHHYLDIRVDKILAKLSRLQTKIAKMEDMFYEESYSGDFANDWIACKRELALIERLMSHATIALSRFYRHYKDSLEELAFKDLAEHVERSFDFAKSAIEKLDNLYSFYRAKMDEKMNKIMFILTIISAIFLPLTLVTGYFGMNTGGLPFTEDPHGTLKVTVALVLFEVPFVLWIYRLLKKG